MTRRRLQAPCLCGGLIAVADYGRVDYAVRQHNMSLMHRIWRLAREGSTADPGNGIDLSAGPPVRPPLPD